MQTQLSGEQLLLSSIFFPQPAPTAAATLEATQEWNDIVLEIEEKRERILELKKEIGDDEEALLNAEEDELEMEPNEGEEVIFDAVAPMLEEDLNNTHYENDTEIRELEEEIEELGAKLK